MANDPSRNRMQNSVDPAQLDEYIDPEERIEFLDVGPWLEGEDDHELNEEVPGEDVTNEMLLEDVERPDSWLHFNKGLEQTGYAPTDRLTPENIDDLEREYVIDTDSAGMQTTTTIVPGDGDTPPVMYFLQTNTVVQAVNARTGEPYWRFQYGFPEDPEYEMSPRYRGLAVAEDKVVFGTANLQMVALDRYTGEKIYDENSMVEELEDLPFPFIGYGHSPAPVVYDGRIFCGQVCGDASLLGHTYMMAFDLDTGEIDWYTIMAPEDEWIGDTWQMANASPWMPPAIDVETDTLFVNSGNPRPMLNPLVRPGPNQMSAGIVAFDIDTGEVKWNDQQSPQDQWDYDAQYTPSIFTAEIDGEERRVVQCDMKNGWSYVYDVETGQIYSRSVPFGEQSDDHHGFIGHGEENATEIWPGAAGASNYPADGLDPERGYRFVGSSDTGEMMWMHEWEWDQEEGVGYGPDGDEDISGGDRAALPGLGEDVEHNAAVTAIDMTTGDHAWRTDLPDIDPEWETFRMYPGGTTPTGGGLVFSASSGGHLYALDADDGEILWEDDTEERITATPVVWEDTEEDAVFVAVASSDRIITYRADVGA